MQVTVILLAAGQGQRMGAAVNKIWLPLNGRPLLQYSLELFEQAPQVSQIIVVAHPGEIARTEQLIARLRLNKAGLVVEGGSTRGAGGRPRRRAAAAANGGLAGGGAGGRPAAVCRRNFGRAGYGYH